MSDPVVGDIGGQPVYLENAATEATLKQLVTAVALLNANMKKTKGGLAGQQEVEDQLKKFLEDLKKQEKNAKKILNEEDRKFTSTRRNTQAVDDNTKSKQDNTRFTYMAGAGLRLLHQTTVGVVLGMTSVIRDLANMGDSATSAAGVFSHIPIVGSMLAGVFGAAAQAAEGVYKSFLTASSVGANFSGSMTEMVMAAGQAGLTFDQFSGIVAKNGESLALLAQGTGEGAKRLAQLGKEIRNSGIADQLYRLGYSTEEINNGMAQFTGRLARAGALQGMTTEQIAKVTGEYLRDLDAVAKLTGKSKESLQAQEDARMRDAQYLTLKSKLDATGQKNLEILMKSIPEGMQEGAKEVLATGTATTEAGRRFLAFMNQSGRSLSDLNRVARQTGTITEQQAMSMAGLIQQEGKALAKSPLGETAGLFIKELNDLIVAAHQLAARQTTISDIFKKSNQDLKKNPPKNLLDPAAMAKLKQDIANISNEFSLFLVNSGLMNTMMKLLKELIPIIEKLIPHFNKLPGLIEKTLVPAFKRLNKFIDETLIPTVKFISDHFGKIAIAAGGAAAALAAVAAIKAAKTIDNVNKGMLLGSTPANPMWVRDVAGIRPGGPSGPGGPGDADKKGDKKGGGKGAGGGRPGTIRAGLGAATVLITGAVLASEISDINQRQREGEISKEQASKEKTVATTGAVGTAGGGVAGMYGGAAIGTMVAGPIGTVVGGLIGGAIGAWLGGKGGTAIAKSVTGATEETVKDAMTKPDKPNEVAAAAIDAKLKKVTRSDILAHPAYKKVFEQEVARNQELINTGRKTQIEVQQQANRVALEAARAEIKKEIEKEYNEAAAKNPLPNPPPRPDVAPSTSQASGSRSNASRNQNQAQARPSTPARTGVLLSRSEIESSVAESKRAQEAAAEAKKAREAEERQNRANQSPAQNRNMSPQERLESLITTLNTSIDTLVGLNIRANTLMADQLAVQRRLGSNNLMRAGA